MKAFFLFTFFSLALTTIGFSEIASPGSQALSRTLNYAKGHQEFRNLIFREHEEEFVRLVKEGQAPKSCFIGCSDSRVIPELIAQAKPGELFVIRTAGNFVPTYDSKISWDGVAATIEYAVQVLKVKDIIVCGHSHCGAIEGLFSEDIQNFPQYQMISRWLQFGRQAKKITNAALPKNATDNERYEITERISVLAQLDHLMSYPFIKRKVEEKEIHLHGWHFTIETGEISYFNPETYQFTPLTNLQLNEVNQDQVQVQMK